MANIKFSYLYRDGGNYKNYKEVIFANPANVDIVELETLIRDKLIEKEFFRADEWLLPDMHFEMWNRDVDHPFHEFESVTYTEESADFSVSLRVFINAIDTFRK